MAQSDVDKIVKAINALTAELKRHRPKRGGVRVLSEPSLEDAEPRLSEPCRDHTGRPGYDESGEDRDIDLYGLLGEGDYSGYDCD